MSLSPKKQRFANEFLVDQNRSKAAIRAGYSKKTADQIGSRLYKDPAVRQVIDSANQRIVDKVTSKAEIAIATKLDRQIFWTQTMQSETVEMKDRLKASQLLGESEADFSQKVQLTGKDGGPIQQTGAIDFSHIDDATLKKLAQMSNGASHQ